MYFVKARKNLEEQDARNVQERNRRDRYQRSDSARSVLQAVPTQQQSKQVDDHDSERLRCLDFGSAVDPEELPDGACYRPRKDLTHLPSTSSAIADGSKGKVHQETKDITNKNSGLTMEHVRPAEYIGTFSVSGSDKGARERQMESQLELMRNAKDKRPVELVISSAGVKVILPQNNNVFMEHSLKRIWYATCDPEYCQFSFLAREPKTSAEVQYCHAFVTASAEQAEELISLIGEAFKSTYSEQQQQQQQPQKSGKEKETDKKDEKEMMKKQPTFHELIEQQVLQQQAKFREIEQEAQSALQQTLTQIATPTPFSERAQSRMEERRRQSEDLSLNASSAAAVRRDWAKHEIHRVKHTRSPDRSHHNSPNRRSEIPAPCRQSSTNSSPKSSPFKRNSVPPQVTLSSSSSQPHPLSALAIKESMESKAASKGSKFKGSPVTALKNEIDRRLSMTNGDDPPLTPHPSFMYIDQQSSSRQQLSSNSSMANRPLPPPPDESRSPQRSNKSPQHQNTAALGSNSHSSPSHARDLTTAPFDRRDYLINHQQRSLDDHHLPRSSTSPQVAQSTPAWSRPTSNTPAPAAGVVRLRDSPRRRQPRPMSEIATSSSGGSSYYEQQRQSLLSNFAASFQIQDSPARSRSNSGAAVAKPDGMYIYGPGPAPPPREGETSYSLAGPANMPLLKGNRRSWAMEEIHRPDQQQAPHHFNQQQQRHKLYEHDSPPSSQHKLQQNGSRQQHHHNNVKQQQRGENGESTTPPTFSSSSSPSHQKHHQQSTTTQVVAEERWSVSPQVQHPLYKHTTNSSGTTTTTHNNDYHVPRYDNHNNSDQPAEGPGTSSLWISNPDSSAHRNTKSYTSR